MKSTNQINARINAIILDNKEFIGEQKVADYLIDAINNNDEEIYSYIEEGEDPDKEREKVIEYIRDNFDKQLN